MATDLNQGIEEGLKAFKKQLRQHPIGVIDDAVLHILYRQGFIDGVKIMGDILTERVNKLKP